MPKLEHEVTPERSEELARRIRRTRDTLPPPTHEETTHTSEASAKRRAARVGLPGTEIGAMETTHGWVGVVYIRPDQRWMTQTIAIAGCRAVEKRR